MAIKQSTQKRTSLPSFGTVFNICCALLLCFNLILNYSSLHEAAIRQSEKHHRIAEQIPPYLRGGTSLEDAISNNYSAIRMAIPHGKAVALPSVRISEEDDKNIERHIYGGKGDKPHLGGFTDFDVRTGCWYDMAQPMISIRLTSIVVLYLTCHLLPF